MGHMLFLRRGVTTWTRLAAAEPISLDHCFRNGQCFGWFKWPDGRFTGVIGTTVITLRNVPEAEEGSASRGIVEYQCEWPPGATDVAPLLEDLFQTNIKLGPIIATWMERDERLKALAPRFQGMRFLRQEPFECLMSFICSSNNNIARITSILAAVRRTFGTKLCDVDDKPFYAFPSCEALSAVPESAFRDIGLGYRAKFVTATTCALLAKGGVPFLHTLRQPSVTRQDAQAALLEFAGVGRKVADCVALFSLDKHDVIPVDTHVWTIACRDMTPSLAAAKSLTPVVYERVGDLFRDKYGSHAGWAHSMLFSDEITAFKPTKEEKAKSPKKRAAVDSAAAEAKLEIRSAGVVVHAPITAPSKHAKRRKPSAKGLDSGVDGE